MSKVKDENFTILRPIYWRVVGKDLYAGILLSKLAHMFTTKGLTYERSGKRWRAYTRSQWYEEIWLTRRLFDRAVTLLRDMRLIETKVMQYGGKTRLHIHLNEKELEAVMVLTVQTGMYSAHHPGGTEGAIPIQQMKEQDEGSTVSCVSSSTHAATKKSEKILEDKMATSTEVLSNLKKKYGEKYSEGFYPKKASELLRFWSYFVPLHHEAKYMKLGAKEAGQASHILKAMKPHPDLLMPTMRWAIENWDAFVLLVKKEKAASIGEAPDIGKLLAFLDVAVKGMQTGEKVKKFVIPKIDYSDKPVKPIVKKKVLG